MPPKTYQFLEISDPAGYNPLSIDPLAPFTQSYEYGQWHAAMGRRVIRIGASREGEYVAYFQVIRYPLVAGVSYFYIPHGPVLKGALGTEFTEAFFAFLRRLARRERVAFLRFDPFPPSSIYTEIFAASNRFRKAPAYSYHAAHFQPKYEWLLDLNSTDEELFKNMDSKHRYSLRTAQKQNVGVDIIEEKFSEHFDAFYEILSETAERDKFHLHPKEYYQAIFEQGEREKSIFLAIGYHNEKPLSIAVIHVWGATATYLLGASRDVRRDVMASYAVQWTAIREAKRKGCQYYNFGAVSPADDPYYRDWEGFTRFKKRFGGTMREYADFYDCVFLRVWYALYLLRKRWRS